MRIHLRLAPVATILLVAAAPAMASPPASWSHPAATVAAHDTSPKPPAAMSTIHVAPAWVASSHPVAIPAFEPPPAGAHRAALVAAGKALVARQVARQRSLLPTTGFESIDDLAKAIAALGPGRAAVVDMLKREDRFEFAMRTPAGIRDSVAARGFLNQYDTRASRGDLRPDVRARSEASYLGLSSDEYSRLPNSLRPKYGYLRVAREIGLEMVDNTRRYGEDVFVFKHDAIKDHITLYPSDSLGSSSAERGVAPSGELWHHSLIPWSERMLLAAHMAVPVGTKELLLGGNPAPPGFVKSPLGFSRYIEMQIWRPIGLEDVERFEFGSLPPTGAFLQALRKNHVKIFHLGEHAEWHGDTTTAPGS